jgi:metal-responsive CopG/Arc/MetJ family transcriptional regulator
MKAALSIPDRLFSAADALARKLRLSRSRLYATALAEYLAKHQGARVTERLDAVYHAEAPKLDAELRRAQQRVLRRVEW